MNTGTKAANYINHVVLVLDKSTSMQSRAAQVIAVADNQVKYLARRSQEMGQETRVTIYTFSDKAECVIFDMDVLRLPSISTLYRVSGSTALIDATMLALGDLAETSQKYGDHAFLVFVLTDGEENRSLTRPAALAQRMATLPENWTVGFMVPDANGVFEAKRFGIPAANIAVWDTSSNSGVSEVGNLIRDTTDAFMAARATGVRGSRTLFSTDAKAVNKDTITAAGLTPLPATGYRLVPVPPPVREIKGFVEDCGFRYQVGSAFYELTKTETIQGTKKLMVLEIATDKVFSGDQVRDLLGLGGDTVRVKPDHNPAYKIFVQSTSVNRHLMPGTRLLVMV